MRDRLFVCAALSVSLLLADGGKVVFTKRAGPLDITLFSSESPLRIGINDLSVMVQKTASQSPVLEAEVKIHLIRQGAGEISEVFVPATHGNASNKLLYAAAANIPKDGRWRVEIEVKSATESALVSGTVEVLPPLPPLLAHWPYFAVVPVLALLFVVNQLLKRKRRALRRA